MIGLGYALFGILSLLFSMDIGSNIIVDFRQLAVMLSAFYGGFPASIITSLIIGIHRLFFVNGLNTVSIIGAVSIMIIGIGTGILATRIHRFLLKWTSMLAFSLIIGNLTFLIVLDNMTNPILLYFSSSLTLFVMFAALVIFILRLMNFRLQVSIVATKLLSNFMTLDSEQVYKETLEELMTLLKSDFGSIMIAHGSIYKIFCTLENGEYELPNYLVREGEVEATSVFKKGIPLLFNNWADSSPNGTLEQRLYNDGVRSSLHFPITYKSEVIACINLGSRTPYQFNNINLLNSLFRTISFGFTLMDSENKFMTITQSAHEAIIVADQNMRITAWNNGAEQIFGYSIDEAVGRKVSIIIPNHLKEAHEQGVSRFLSSGQASVMGTTLEVEGLHKDGTVFPIEFTLNKWDTGGVVFFSGIIRDITERNRIQKSLSESEERYRKLIELSPDSICVYQENKLVYANDKALKQLGFRDSSMLIGTDSLAYLASEYHARIKELIRKLYEQGDVFSNEEIAIINSNGERRYYEISASLIMYKGKPAIMTTFRDISIRKEAKQKLLEANELLKKLSDSDGLTGIANRRYFDEQLEQIWKNSMISQRPVSLIFCDIDFFKEFNDTYGHLEGDICLKKVASVLSMALDNTDNFAARYGGEEFTILLTNADVEQALEVAAKVRHRIHSIAIKHESSKINEIITLSIGVATLTPTNEITHLNLLGNADKAMYKAKIKGKDRVELYKPV
jgi:diguanylate cyclase (GGDEF)-like protein/PAS domain S-box-containing protein